LDLIKPSLLVICVEIYEAADRLRRDVEFARCENRIQFRREPVVRLVHHRLISLRLLRVQAHDSGSEAVVGCRRGGSQFFQIRFGLRDDLCPGCLRQETTLTRENLADRRIFTGAFLRRTDGSNI
jgi:hypothetical protein